MMKKLAVIVLMAVLAACGSATKEELASLAAKGYYDHLIHGEYEQFYEGFDQRALSDEAGYRSQMLDNLRQFRRLRPPAGGSERKYHLRYRLP